MAVDNSHYMSTIQNLKKNLFNTNIDRNSFARIAFYNHKLLKIAFLKLFALIKNILNIERLVMTIINIKISPVYLLYIEYSIFPI